MFFWNSLAFSMIQRMLAIWSGSSAFSKTSLNIWKFMVHILLKPGLENFENYFASMWDECNCVVVWTFFQFSSVQSLSRVQLFVTPWTAAHQASLSITNSWSLLKLMSIELSNHCNLCWPLLPPPSIFPRIRVFKWVGSSHQVAKGLEFQLQHQSFQWIFRTDFL